MRLYKTILLSSVFVTTLLADQKEIVNYDEQNGFVYYSDGSVYMINDTQPVIDQTEEVTPADTLENLPIAQFVEEEPVQIAETTESVVEKTEKNPPNSLENLPIAKFVEEDRQKAKTAIPLTQTIQKTIPEPMITTSVSTPKTVNRKTKSGKLVGNIKLLHVIDGKDNGYDTTTGSTYYINGGYVTPEVNGVSAKVTGYVVGDTGLTETGKDAKIANGQFMGEKTKDKSTILKTKANIQEAYIKYKNPKFKAQVGHMTLNTPMTKNSVSTVPNLYEGAIVSSKALVDDTIVVGAHMTKMAYGARAISDWSRIGEKTDTAGSVKVYGEQELETLAGDESLPVKIRRGKFVNFGKIADKDNTAGMSIVGAINKSIKNTTIQAWEYFIYDVANITYIDGMAKFKLSNGVKTMVGAQIMHQNIKDSDGNPMLFGLKAAASYQGAKVILALNKSNGDAMLNIWGGDPAYTSMVHSKNAYRPDVTAVKIVGSYKIPDFKGTLPKNLSLTIAHGNFSKSSLKNAQKDASETDIALKYEPKKNILFKLANVQRETEFDGYKGIDKTQNMTKFVMKYKF